MEKILDLLPSLFLTSSQRLRQRSAYQVGSGRRAGKTQDSAEVEAGSNICTRRRKYKKKYKKEKQEKIKCKINDKNKVIGDDRVKLKIFPRFRQDQIFAYLGGSTKKR